MWQGSTGPRVACDRALQGLGLWNFISKCDGVSSLSARGMAIQAPLAATSLQVIQSFMLGRLASLAPHAACGAYTQPWQL
jgi:hypothetical protein